VRLSRESIKLPSFAVDDLQPLRAATAKNAGPSRHINGRDVALGVAVKSVETAFHDISVSV